MIELVFPSGDRREYPLGITALEVAKDISPTLARKALSATFNEQVIELQSQLLDSGNIRFFTWEDEQGKRSFWHSSAHLLAQALQHFYSDIKLTIGPPIRSGFYYDVDFMGQSFSEPDFHKVEAKMLEIAKQKHAFHLYPVSQSEALDKYRRENNPYKIEIIEGLKEQEISFCRHDDFIDLCRGGHIPHTAFIKAVKITSVAGAYWRGDASKPQLTRVYGISFPKQSMLGEYLKKVEMAKERDHRKLGKKLELFTFSRNVGIGLPMWLPKGVRLKQSLENFLMEQQKKIGYEMVATPHIAQKKLYEVSGHYQKYGADSFRPIQTPNPDEEFMLKPMNCPHHCEIYKYKPRSYRDLPLRYAEFGTVYRYEQSGELSGLTRVRGFTQDDAHIFCTQEQLKDEFKKVIELVVLVFERLGFKDYTAQISVRDLEDKEKYIGSDSNWKKAESAIIEAAQEKNIEMEVVPGEAAFYGPKLDFMVRDVMDREWQLGTIQVDYNLPERFDLQYIDESNQHQRPVMIHRAPFGSLERFIAILLEHTGGDFPLWLHPVPVRILPISTKFIPYAMKVQQFLQEGTGLLVEVDQRNEKVSRKVRDAEVDKVAYMCIIGEKEIQEESVSFRKRGDKDQGNLSLIDLREKFKQELKFT